MYVQPTYDMRCAYVSMSLVIGDKARRWGYLLGVFDEGICWGRDQGIREFDTQYAHVLEEWQIFGWGKIRITSSGGVLGPLIVVAEVVNTASAGRRK
jgi:hypothetical protein